MDGGRHSNEKGGIPDNVRITGVQNKDCQKDLPDDLMTLQAPGGCRRLVLTGVVRKRECVQRCAASDHVAVPRR